MMGRTSKWIKASLVRAVKTFAQVAVSLITVGQAFYEIGWLNVLSVAGVAAIASILTSIAGLPEVEYADDDAEQAEDVLL